MPCYRRTARRQLGQAAVCALLVFVACGGQSRRRGPALPSGGAANTGHAGAGGGTDSAGTATGEAVGDDFGEGGSAAQGAAGAVAAGSAAVGGEPRGLCDLAALWQDITDTATLGLGQCARTSDPLPPLDQPPNRLNGAVIVDGDGRVVDNTGLSDPEKQAWLKRLADQRWPCFAGQTVRYECRVTGD
jgi:hypothetical protein